MKKAPPYMYEFFNTFGFITCIGAKNVLTRILNAIIEGFNRCVKLPRYIFIILDKNLIEAAVFYKYDYGVKKMLERWMRWLSRTLDRYIETRKQDLISKRPGAVSAHEPKIIWIKMIDRPHVQRGDPRFKVYSQRNKFNDLLDELATNKRNNHVLNVESLEADRHFTRPGELNEFGALQYWKEIDYYFKKFDRREINLDAKKDKNNRTEHR